MKKSISSKIEGPAIIFPGSIILAARMLDRSKIAGNPVLIASFNSFDKSKKSMPRRSSDECYEY